MTQDAKQPEHTPEPWDYKRDDGSFYLYARDINPLYYYIGIINDIHGDNEANARRIVACVNKLAEWSIEDLEDDTIRAARWDTVPKKAEVRGGPLREPDIIDLEEVAP